MFLRPLASVIEADPQPWHRRFAWSLPFACLLLALFASEISAQVVLSKTPEGTLNQAAVLLGGEAQTRAAGDAARPASRPEAKAEPTDPSKSPRSESETRVDGLRNGEQRQSQESPETTFQTFVRSSHGRSVPLFGYELFAESAFPSLTNVPVSADYVIGPGDEIIIRLWGSVEADLKTQVDRNGEIALPRIGTLRVAGIQASQLEATVRAAVAKTFKNFELSASLGRLRAIQIFVVGHAKKPGAYMVSSMSTLLGALFEVGGPAHTGTMRSIRLRRQGQIVTTLDLYKFFIEGDKSADARLQPGDVIVISSAGPRVALVGSIERPAIYELRAREEALADVLSYNGSLGALTSLHRVQVERVDPGNSTAPRSVQERAVDTRSLAEPLRDGDIITMFSVGPQFSNAVTLRGNVAAPLRYAHKPGMRISDLIPERQALIQPDYYSRKNLLVQHERSASVTADRLANEVRNLLSEINWDYAVVERLDAQAIRTTLLPFNLGKAVLEKSAADDLLLLPGDVVTIFSVNDIPVPRHRATRLVKVAGEVNAAGVYQIEAGETLKSLMQRAGGPTPQAYLFGTEFTRESARQRQKEALQDALRRLEATSATATAVGAASLSSTDPAVAQRLVASQQQAREQQLSRLRNLQPTGRISLELQPNVDTLDKLPDLALENGDSIVVPPAPGFVNAVGAVANGNSLLWRPGRTVRQYLRAAGVEPNADEENIFILRADGSIVHRRDFGRFFGNFESAELAQGDTLVVPERTELETKWSGFVRGFKDWSQILGNLGLTAAAIKSLSR